MMLSVYCLAILPSADRTLISEIVEESDFSDTAYNSEYVSDVQSLIAKSTLQTIFN